MGFRFRKSFEILPGVKINVGKQGASISVGPKGAKLNIGPNGTRATASIPGTGISYSTKLSGNKKSSSKANVCPNCGHKMRKKWDNCPKCHVPLVYETSETETDAPSTESHKPNRQLKTATSSGCLLPIVYTSLAIIVMCILI